MFKSSNRSKMGFDALAISFVSCVAAAMLAVAVLGYDEAAEFDRAELQRIVDWSSVHPAGVNLSAECGDASYCVYQDVACTSDISTTCADGEEEEDTGIDAYECYDEDNICDYPWGPHVVCGVYRGKCYWNAIGVCALTPELDQNGNPNPDYYEDEISGYWDCENWF